MSVRIMSRRQRRCLRRLVRIAGHPELVCVAFRAVARAGGRPTLEDVVRYILTERDGWHRRLRPAS